jgi:hypothetical protein
MNRFTEEINIHSDIAIDAIIKYANYIHGGEVWARSNRDYATLQAKCERYEKALQSIVTPNLYSSDTWDEIADKMIRTANEALTGYGEKEVRDEV